MPTQRARRAYLHDKPYGELYDLQRDPHEYDNLWDDPQYEKCKADLIHKNFDSAIMRNMDFSLNKLYSF